MYTCNRGSAKRAAGATEAKVLLGTLATVAEGPVMAKPCVYVVRCWVDPARSAPLIAWIDGGHMADVASQPGFRGARRVRLEETAPDGWEAHLMIYELESREALQTYFGRKDLAERYAAERAPFADALRIERSWGEVALAVGG